MGGIGRNGQEGGSNQPPADKEQRKELGRRDLFSPSLAPSQSVNRSIYPSLSVFRISLCVCNLSLLLCQARVKTKTRLGLWLGRVVQGTQGYQMPIF